MNFIFHDNCIVIFHSVYVSLVGFPVASSLSWNYIHRRYTSNIIWTENIVPAYMHVCVCLKKERPEVTSVFEKQQEAHKRS